MIGLVFGWVFGWCLFCVELDVCLVLFVLDCIGLLFVIGGWLVVVVC